MKQAHESKEGGIFTSFRILLCLFFLIYAYFVAKGLEPLPDEPPRINFWGGFCLTGGVMAGIYCLVSRYRFFLVGTWMFLPIAIWQMNTRIRFLEMMLEPHAVQVALNYGLYAVLLVLISPVAFRTFDLPISAYKIHRKLLLQKGLPF